MELEIGSIYEGKVTGITKFGAFVLLPMGKSGMVHISEVANTFVDDINNFLKEGQTVTVKLIAIDQQGRINLSIKRPCPSPSSPSGLPALPAAVPPRPGPPRPGPPLRLRPVRPRASLPCSLPTRAPCPRVMTPSRAS